jgi:pSer/pThr/pTyr-binding forkhead associated (FHA) protein
MIVCQKCSTENLDGSQYCDECGTLLPAQGAPAVSAARTTFIGQRASDLTAQSEQNGEDLRAPETAQPFAPSHTMSSRTPGGDIAAKLIIQRGRSAGKEFLLDEDEMQIGRWDADGGIFPDIDLDSDDPEAKVSRRHARIVRRNNQYFIEDLGSTNGTFVNRGRRLMPGDLQPLRDGDEIIVGKTFLRLRITR